MKRYGGSRRVGSIIVSVEEPDNGRGKVRGLKPRHDLRNHSPAGFEWGYQGSGPAQLALALCADALGDDVRALTVYQRVKQLLVAGWKGDTWTTTDSDIIALVEQIERDRDALRAEQEGGRG